jgi:hypothetical protein
MFTTWRPPWRKSIEIRDDPAALKALAALEEDLWEKGWERTRRAPGAEWYELRFRPATSASRPPAASHLRQVTSRSDDPNDVDVDEARDRPYLPDPIHRAQHEGSLSQGRPA